MTDERDRVFEVSSDEILASYRFCQNRVHLSDGIVIKRLLGRMLHQMFNMENEAWPSPPFRRFQVIEGDPDLMSDEEVEKLF